ncbi:inositol monophosphatase family protein [Nioella ostreopsis]|uniref:inositol monophosphatase family protein n=1 Tax=Nioella ostreopsis TaxID=2448479 RepID=UPI000FDCA4E8|nr:inositol monophosphatase family protein [Nioella ostreopsis]
MTDLPALLATALRITGDAADISRSGFNAVSEIDLKSDESPVTASDRATEKAIREALVAEFPEDGIFGEEYGIEGLDRPRVWVVDPIDGTKSFITGVPLFGMLMALVEDGETLLGIIRLPALDQVYAGARGLGATKDGKPIRVSRCTALTDATLFINEAEKIHGDDPALFGRLCTAGKLRRMGYDCHPHALVAEGRIDAVVDYDLKPYDYLPVAGVVEAAGGIMTDWQGQPLNFESDGRVVSAATPDLHAELLAFLNA